MRLTRRRAIDSVVLLVTLLVATNFFSRSPHNVLSNKETKRAKDPIAIGPPCWRNCTHHDNLIVYTYVDQQGLYDRLWVLERLFNLAGYLCATVWFPKPRVMLTPRHNHGQDIDPKVTWSDFVVYSWMNNDKNTTVTVEELENPKFLRFFQDPNYKDWTKLISSRPQDPIWHFARAQQVSFGWQRFLWQIDVNWYDSPMGGIELPDFCMGKGCWYVSNRGVPSLMAGLVDTIWDDIRSRHSSPAVSFQIRRGDAISECDTSLERLQSYLKCSLPQKRDIMLLLASDEKGTRYRQAVQQIIESYFPQVSVVDLDGLVSEHLHRAVLQGRVPERNKNNYYIFRVQGVIREKTDFQLRLRRGVSCNDCDQVVLD